MGQGTCGLLKLAALALYRASNPAISSISQRTSKRQLAGRESRSLCVWPGSFRPSSRHILTRPHPVREKCILSPGTNQNEPGRNLQGVRAVRDPLSREAVLTSKACELAHCACGPSQGVDLRPARGVNGGVQQSKVKSPRSIPRHELARRRLESVRRTRSRRRSPGC